MPLATTYGLIKLCREVRLALGSVELGDIEHLEVGPWEVDFRLGWSMPFGQRHSVRSRFDGDGHVRGVGK